MLMGLIAPLAIVDFSLYLRDTDFDHLPTDLRFYESEYTFDYRRSPPSHKRRTYSMPQPFSTPTSPVGQRRRRSSFLASSSSSSSSAPSSPANSRALEIHPDEELLEKNRLFADRPTLEQMR